MKKSMALTAVLIGFLFVMGGCSEEKAKSQGKDQPANQPAALPNEQVAADLAKYLAAEDQAMKPWATINKLTADLPQAKSAKAYATKLRKEFVPLVTEVAAQMAAIKPATKEVQDIHNAYQASINDYLAGLQSMADAVEKNDDKLVSESSIKLNAFAPAQAKFSQDTKALAARNNVKTN